MSRRTNDAHTRRRREARARQAQELHGNPNPLYWGCPECGAPVRALCRDANRWHPARIRASRVTTPGYVTSSKPTSSPPPRVVNAPPLTPYQMALHAIGAA
jgi:hypothetical protein